MRTLRSARQDSWASRTRSGMKLSSNERRRAPELLRVAPCGRSASNTRMSPASPAMISDKASSGSPRGIEMARHDAGGAVIRPVGVEEDQGGDGVGAHAIAVQGLMAAVPQRLAPLDLGEKERTGQHPGRCRQQRRQTAGPLHRRIQIDQRMAPPDTAGRRPLIAGPHPRIEGSPQSPRASFRHGPAEQQITVARQRSGLIRCKRGDLGGRQAMAHDAPYNPSVFSARASHAAASGVTALS